MDDKDKLGSLIINDVVTILHDSNGKPYYEAIETLYPAQSKATSIEYVESSVIFLFLRNIFRGNLRRSIIKFAFKNTLFRLCVPVIKNRVIVMGMAPYDIRFFFYSLLAFRNNLIFHTSWPFWWTSRVPKRFSLLRPLLEMGYAWVLNHYPIKIVCVTDAVRESLINKVSSERCFTIPHALNTDLYRPSRDERERKMRLLYVGRLVPEKGVELLLELSRRLDPADFELHIVGGGPLAGMVRQEAEVSPMLSYHGVIHDKPDLAVLMGSCDVLLLPSRRVAGWEELFGIVVIEAMSCGLVVLATDHLGPASIIRDGADGILLPDGATASQFKSIIEELVGDRPRMKLIARQARNSALQYDLRQVAIQWHQVITL